MSAGTSGGVINLGVNPAGVAGGVTVGAFIVGAAATSGVLGVTFTSDTAATVIPCNVGTVLGVVTLRFGSLGASISPIATSSGAVNVISPTSIVGGVTTGAVISFFTTVFSTIVFSATAFGVIFAPKSILSTNSNGFFTTPYSPYHFPL